MHDMNTPDLSGLYKDAVGISYSTVGGGPAKDGDRVLIPDGYGGMKTGWMAGSYAVSTDD